eukprot:Mrub_06593.p2 GENE.Mrub_06593~~Mrub_06593.p2  ORF type:complete len:189 (-),score=42.40 Mrub_06593:11-577(-)
MGVPAFFRYLTMRYPKILSKLSFNSSSDAANLQSNNPQIDNLYIDMNGIIHPCCIPSNHYKPKSEQEMFEIIGRQLDQLLDQLQPRKLLFISIDGVAPRAKMNQQRQRRFLSAVERQDYIRNKQKVYDVYKQKGMTIPKVIYLSRLKTVMFSCDKFYLTILNIFLFIYNIKWVFQHSSDTSRCAIPKS